MENILANLKIEQLTGMQEAALDAFRAGADIILLSPTGSGKTLAYLLPVVEWLRADPKRRQAVVLVPSRELTLQTEQVFKAMGTELRAACCYGGRPAMDEHRAMRSQRPDVIIGTPGRMLDHLTKGNIDGEEVGLLVIDEFDKCLEYGFQEEMESVIGHLPSLSRRFLLSATDADEIPRFTGLERTIRLDFLDAGEKQSERLGLMKVMSPSKDKLETLFRLLCTLGDGQALVFCNHRESVERVGQYLRSKGVYSEIYHGGMSQDDRERALYKFRSGSCLTLVSTDLAARGLDIPTVRNVIHYHLPADADSFTHRNGRTARWDASGSAFIILHDEETTPTYIPAETEFYRLPEQAVYEAKPRYVTIYIGKGKRDKISKTDILGFLCKKGGLTNEEVGRIDVKPDCAFAAISRKKARQTLRLLQNEKIKGVKTVVEIAK